MKKISLWLLVLLLVVAVSTPVIANTPVKLFINGLEAPVEALLINGKTYVPVRYVSETLGAKVNYEKGVVKVSTAAFPRTPGISVDQKVLAGVPIKNPGEKVNFNGITYTIKSVTYQTKGAKQYAKITFIEETLSPEGNFGLLPTFVYQKGQELKVLTDYSITAEAEKKTDNNDYRRTFSYIFPCDGKITHVYYYPPGTAKPIGKWTP